MVKALTSININCDLGEGMANDAELMPYLYSCNIACGGHYGDSESMRSTIELAMQHQVKVGAHPSFPDRENFGRKEMKINIDELDTSIRKQVGDFSKVCKSLSIEMHHVKLHGALYNLAAKDEAIAKMILRVLNDYSGVLLYAPYNSILADLADTKLVCYEAFIDRSYENDLSLVHRSEPNALIKTSDEAWNQIQTILTTGTVNSVHGKSIPIKADTFCIHGDNERALSILEFIHNKLKSNE